MVLMGGASVTVLHGCLVAKLSSTTSSSFKNCCEVLHMLLRHHADAVVGAVSAFIQCVKSRSRYSHHIGVAFFSKKCFCVLLSWEVVGLATRSIYWRGDNGLRNFPSKYELMCLEFIRR